MITTLLHKRNIMLFKMESDSFEEDVIENIKFVLNEPSYIDENYISISNGSDDENEMFLEYKEF